MRNLTLLFLAACGGTTANLTPELYDRLSRDDRAAIYERENDVTIQLSRRDDAKQTVRSTEKRLDELAEQWKRCRERLEKANQAAKIDSAAKLRDTHKAFLDDQLRIAEAHVTFRELEIRASKARLELQKERQLVKSGVDPEKNLEEFEKAVRDAEAEAKAGEKKEIDLRAESQKRFLEWKAAEAEYARSSGDYDSLVWVD